jgi:hypothetical protein
MNEPKDPANDDATHEDGPEDTAADTATSNSTKNGPTFTDSPDPLAGVRKTAGEAWASTEGKTVSMRVYIGSIAAVIVLMLLARCGG